MTTRRYSRHFSPSDQRWFAEFSGDVNPIHVAPDKAGSTHGGQPVVHGMHMVLWLLDTVASQVRRGHSLREFKVKFIKPCWVGEKVLAEVITSDRVSFKAHLTIGETTLLALDAETREQPMLKLATRVRNKRPRKPLILSADAIATASGIVSLPHADNALRRRFPNLAKNFGDAIAPLCAALSQLVGMHCPGLYSLFAGVSLTIDSVDVISDNLTYRVQRTDDRFRLVYIEVDCDSRVKGIVHAFWREAFVSQPSIASVSHMIEPGEFSGKHALVVGGTRGIGEATSKLIAAGGGRVTCTYHSSKAGAQRVVKEIRGFGGECSAIQFDALRPTKLPTDVDAVFYFATPWITPRRMKRFDHGLFEKFLLYYVQGFVKLCECVNNCNNRTASIFFPSTVFLDQPTAEFVEYAMAKAAGEEFSRAAEHILPNIRVVASRLPRIQTDQTSSFIPLQCEQAADVMLPVVRSLLLGA